MLGWGPHPASCCQAAVLAQALEIGRLGAGAWARQLIQALDFGPGTSSFPWMQSEQAHEAGTLSIIQRIGATTLPLPRKKRRKTPFHPRYPAAAPFQNPVRTLASRSAAAMRRGGGRRLPEQARATVMPGYSQEYPTFLRKN